MLALYVDRYTFCVLLIKRKILEITIRISFAFFVVVVIVIVVVYQIQFANFVKKMQSIYLCAYIYT